MGLETKLGYSTSRPWCGELSPAVRLLFSSSLSPYLPFSPFRSHDSNFPFICLFYILFLCLMLHFLFLIFCFHFKSAVYSGGKKSNISPTCFPQRDLEPFRQVSPKPKTRDFRFWASFVIVTVHITVNEKLWERREKILPTISPQERKCN